MRDREFIPRLLNEIIAWTFPKSQRLDTTYQSFFPVESKEGYVLVQDTFFNMLDYIAMCYFGICLEVGWYEDDETGHEYLEYGVSRIDRSFEQETDVLHVNQIVNDILAERQD